MPWTARQASRKSKKAKSATAKRQWAHVANNVLKRTGDDRLAIIEANGVLKKRAKTKRK